MANNYLNQSWPVPGGYALLTVCTTSPLPADAVTALEPVIEAIETWRSAVAEMTHPKEAG